LSTQPLRQERYRRSTCEKAPYGWRPLAGTRLKENQLALVPIAVTRNTAFHWCRYCLQSSRHLQTLAHFLRNRTNELHRSRRPFDAHVRALSVTATGLGLAIKVAEAATLPLRTGGSEDSDFVLLRPNLIRHRITAGAHGRTTATANDAGVPGATGIAGGTEDAACAAGDGGDLAGRTSDAGRNFLAAP
jgi:hypothetical protein